LLGLKVGTILGDKLDINDGAGVGEALDLLGKSVSINDGKKLGPNDGFTLGRPGLGSSDGLALGIMEGSEECTIDGNALGPVGESVNNLL